MRADSVVDSPFAKAGLLRTGLCMLSLALALMFSSPSVQAAKTVKVKAMISVAEELNPDYQGRSSPVNVIVFQLASSDAFENSDFFSLYDPEATVLGGDLLGRTQLLLKPGEEREWDVEFDRETRFVGIIAAYRDIENAQWRSIEALPTKGLIGRFFSKNKLKIVVDTLAVSVTTK